jgi:uncharacterized membrane-anchored protein
MTDTTKTGPAGHRQDVEARRDVIEQEAAVGVAILLRSAEIGVVVFMGLLVVPPLGILAVVVVVPLLVIAIVLGLAVAIVATPYLLVRHVREHHRTHGSSALVHHLRRLRPREA